MKHARVIQQNVEAAEMRQGLLDDTGNLVRLSHIRCKDKGGTAAFMGCFFEPFSTTADQSDFRAFAG